MSIYSSATCKSFIFIFSASCNCLFLFLKSLFSSFKILIFFWKVFFSDSDFSFWHFRSSNVLASWFVFMLSVSFSFLFLSFNLLWNYSSSFIFLSNSAFSDFVVLPCSSSAALSLWLLLLFVLLFLRSVLSFQFYIACLYILINFL